MSKSIVAVDLGYSGELDLTIKLTDQNGQTHEQTFAFHVFGQKPTCLTAGVIVDEEPRILYSTTSEVIASRQKEMPIDQRIRLAANTVWELGKVAHDGSFDRGQRIKALASELHQVAREIENHENHL